MNTISPRTTTPITHYIILNGVVWYTKQLNSTIWNTFCTTSVGVEIRNFIGGNFFIG